MSNDILQNAKIASGVHQFDLNGNVYVIRLLPASVGLSIGTKLIKMAAPVLGIIADNNVEGSLEFSEEKDLFYQASTVLVNSMDDEQIVELIQTLLFNFTFNGKQVDFDVHFRAKYGELLAVLEVALKENFGDFLSSYLKAKGIEIPSLRDIMTKKAPTQEEQD